MSVKAMAWAWTQEALSEGEKLLLMAVADHADDEGVCWPGQVGLAKKCGVTDRTVRTRLKKLETLGLIAREPRYNAEGKRTSDRITLNFTTGKSFRRKIFPPETTASGEPSEGTVPSTGVSTSTQENSSSTGKEPPTPTKPSTSTTSGKPPPVQVDRLRLTNGEWQMAQAIIAEFNAQVGTRFSLLGSRGRPTEHLKRIVGRIRENPEVPLERHLEVIRHTCANPWWGAKAPTSIGVIYGPQAFLRCLAMEKPERNFADERAPSEGVGW